MQNEEKNTARNENSNNEKQKIENPVQAGKAAIEAGKLNEAGKPAAQQHEEELKDAEAWRNEG